MNKIQKYILKRRNNEVKTVDMSDMDEYSQLPLFEGIYTVRNIIPETSDDLFVFDSHYNMVSGYIDSNSEKTISILGNKKKLVASMVNSFYHSVLDNMSAIIFALEKYPKHELIIDVSELGKDFGPNLEHKPGFFYHNAFLYFLETLKIKKIKYRLVHLKQYDVVYINNFRVINYFHEPIEKADAVYDFFKSRVSSPEKKPHRKVFISRSLTVGRNFDAPTLKYSNDDRMDNHKQLDGLFASMGYEIITTETIGSFQEQLDLFYETKILASLTGSGLANAAFMQPGQTVVEIVTPLVVTVGRPGERKDKTDLYFVQELHNFYKNVAFYKDHTYFAIHNESRDFEILRNKIENDSKIKNFLDRSDE
jgi:hypothetical protein